MKLRTIIILVVALAILAVFPMATNEFSIILILFLFFDYVALANMWNLLAGYSGLVSLGGPAFVGVAGYTLGALSLAGVSPFIGIVFAGAVAAGFAFLISFPTLRLRGLYFSIGTLMVTEAMSLFFVAFKPPGASSAQWGGAGIVIRGAETVTLTDLYYLAVAVGVISIFVVHYVLKSKLGLGLKAIRDNENAASSLGVNIFRSKMYSLMIAGFVTGLASAVFYINQGLIEPISGFGIPWLMIMLMATIVGGIGTEEGPIIGAAVVVLLQQYLASFIGVNLLIQGVILVVIISIAPMGIWGSVRKFWTRRSMATKPAAPVKA
jgi:branched-chain amino acid transport system permease protein